MVFVVVCFLEGPYCWTLVERVVSSLDGEQESIRHRNVASEYATLSHSTLTVPLFLPPGIQLSLEFYAGAANKTVGYILPKHHVHFLLRASHFDTLASHLLMKYQEHHEGQ
jgi:hypothetical protein